MGTPMAPSYANIFMGKIESDLLNEYESKTGLKPTLWLRFLDDIFFVWNDSVENLQLFMKELNNHHDYIKFTISL